MKQIHWHWLIALLSYASSCCSQTIPTNYHKALEAAKSSFPNQSIPIIKDELVYARQLSLKPNIEDSFHTVNVCSLVDRMQLWNKYLPHVNIYYAVKANHDEVVTSVLAALGSGFDCASIGEMRQVLKLGVNPEKIIFSHPRKPIDEIVFAEKNRIKLMVFDSIEELDKMRQYAPSGKYILRIKTHDEHSAAPLSSKFGTTITGAYKILDYAYKNKAPVVGVSFHVGSNNLDATAFTQALKDASELFKYSQTKWNRMLTILDLGGGWPGNNDERFVFFADVVNRGIAQYLPKNTQVIAEPGRYFATQMITVVLRIIGTEQLKTSKGIKYAYYLSNGAYGFFLASIYHQYNPDKIALQGWSFHPLKLEKKHQHQQYYPTILWGPTCDSGDKILDNAPLPKMQLNDFIYTKNAGAYTYSLQTDFNQITASHPYPICMFDAEKSSINKDG